jgi:hypothetical protein
MNVERLYAISTAIIDDINQTQSDIILQRLISSLQNQINAPQQPQGQQQVSQHLTSLYNALLKSSSNK